MAATEPHPARPPVPGRTKKIAGLGVAVVGLGAVAAGVAFGVLARQAGDAVTADARAHNPFVPSKESTGRTDQILEGVLLGAGALAVAGGAALYYLGRRETRAAGRHELVVAPAATPGFAGAIVKGSF